MRLSLTIVTIQTRGKNFDAWESVFFTHDLTLRTKKSVAGRMSVIPRKQDNTLFERLDLLEISRYHSQNGWKVFWRFFAPFLYLGALDYAIAAASPASAKPNLVNGSDFVRQSEKLKSALKMYEVGMSRLLLLEGVHRDKPYI